MNWDLLQKPQIESILMVVVGGSRVEKAQEFMIFKCFEGLRIFDDENDRMNLPISDAQGILVVSQFTLYGNLRKGFRPSFNKSAEPEFARVTYDRFLNVLSEKFKGVVQSGRFGENMFVEVEEEGPVTIWLDSHEKAY